MEGIAFIFTARHDALLLPQELSAVTQIFPFTAPLPKSTKMELVPCPEFTVAPDGTVQLYEVAPLTALIEYATANVFAQTLDVPEIDPGVIGAEYTVTEIEFDIAGPHPFVTVQV